MLDVNRVFLGGNLTRDPEVVDLPGGSKVTNFSVAVNRKYHDKQDVLQTETCYVDCRAYAKKGETIGKYFKKGRPIFIEGRLRFESWEEENGKKRNKLRVVVDNFSFVDSKGTGDEQPTTTTEKTSSDAFGGEAVEEFDAIN
jgi:single-strand DNA-binding protein